MRCVYGLCVLGLAAANLVTKQAAADPVPSSDPTTPTAVTVSIPEAGAVAKPVAVSTPASVSASTPAQADVATKPGEPFVEPPNEGRGFVVQIAPFGAVIPFGNFAEGVDATSFGAGMTVGALAGVYVTEHFGALGGVSGSHSHQGMSGCKRETKECGGFTYQFPIVVQYAFQNRKQGLYLQTGFAFASTYKAYEEAHTYTASSPFDVKLGLGYRVARGAILHQAEPSRWSADVYANLDIGQFDNTVTHSGAGQYEGSIAHPDVHYMAGFGVALNWTP